MSKILSEILHAHFYGAISEPLSDDEAKNYLKQAEADIKAWVAEELGELETEELSGSNANQRRLGRNELRAIVRKRLQRIREGRY